MRWNPRIAIALLVLACLALATGMYANARADPIVREATVALPGWPADAPPLRIILWSDPHLGNAATDPERLTRIARQIAALGPDLVLIAGDLIAGHEPGSASPVEDALVAALRILRPPLGLIAVPGNHDHWTGIVSTGRAVRRAGGIVLRNAAVRRGPLAIGGVDDAFTGHARLAPTVAALRRLRGVALMVSHSPDIALALPRDVSLLLAGHSHCGQIVFPLYGPPVVPLRSGTRYLCGIVQDGTRTVIVSAGTGTSALPLRLGAPPDLWLVTVGRAGR